MRISFDLDDVLFVSPEKYETEPPLRFPYNRLFPDRLRKGTPLLIDYLDLFRRRTGRDVRLVLTGSGAVDIPETLQGAVLDLGFVSEEEKREAMAGAAAFCHPSVNESLSIVLIEAWLARTPALVHADGAVLRDQCRRANGGLWFHNYPEFEEELAFLLDHPAEAAALAARGRDYAIRTYSPEAVTRRLLEALPPCAPAPEAP